MAEMSLDEVVEQLHKMRAAGREQHEEITLMMHLFGILYSREVGIYTASGIVTEYLARYGVKIGAPAISDGRKLARHVTVDTEMRVKWGKAGHR